MVSNTEGRNIWNEIACLEQEVVGSYLMEFGLPGDRPKGILVL